MPSSHEFILQARLELASTIRCEAERDTESGDSFTDESTGDGVRCDVHKRCSFRSAGESVGAGKDEPVAVRVGRQANNVNVDAVESRRDWLECCSRRVCVASPFMLGT